MPKLRFHGAWHKNPRRYQARRQSTCEGHIPKGVWVTARSSLAASFMLTASHITKGRRIIK